MTPTTRRVLAALAALLLIAGTAACGDDDGGEGDVAAYCEASAALDGTEEPTQEQFDAVVNAAPDEVRTDIQFLVDLFNELGGGEEAIEAFLTDEEAIAASERVEAFEAENCDEPTEESDGGASTTFSSAGENLN